MFTINASRIEMFFSCPARYKYSLELQRKSSALARHLKIGLNVHARHEGVPPKFKTGFDYIEGAMYDLMCQAVAGYTWLGQPETRQQVELAPGILINRTLDRMGRFKKVDRLVDWKTAGKMWWTGWSAGNIISPRSQTFQAKAYLIPPADPAPFKRWPRRIEFVVSDGTMAEIHAYEPSDQQLRQDRQDLRDAIETIRAAKSFPKRSGYGCQYCDFFERCFNTEGAKSKFEPLNDPYQEFDE